MKEKKELKKLNLEKEEVINLNEYEMDAVKGGSSYPCVKTIIETIKITIATYSIAQTASVINCVTPAPTPTPTPTPTGGNCTCGCTLAPDNWTM